MATQELAGVRNGADLSATLRGLYDGGRITKGALDSALATMGSMQGGPARDVRSLLTAFQSEPQFKGGRFGAAEPPAPAAAAARGGDGARDGVSSYGYDPYFPLKYGPGFAHIDHVDPDAPKGGELKFVTTAKFDTYNPFDWTKAGGQNAAPQLRRLVFQTLMAGTGENGTSQYGLVAESVRYPKDLSWVEFKIRPQARYSNGAPVTAQDIEFSYKTQRASDQYFDLMSMKPVVGVQVVDERTIRFALKAESSRQAQAAIRSLGWLYVLNKDYYTKHPLSSLDDMKVPPLGSGPYVVEKGEQGKYVVYKRDPNYWGKDLPLQKGQYNFDQVRYDRYSDPATARMAFQRGDANVWFESDESQWEGVQKRAKDLGYKTEEIPYDMPPGFMGLAFNTNKAIFRDARVRRALSLAMNYPWINRNMFQGAMTPATSFFQGTPFAHGSTVSDEERRLLASFGDLPPAVFDADPNPAAPAATDAYNRENLKRAMALLKEAGWKVDPDSLQLVDGAGRPFEFTVVYVQPATEKYLLAYAAGLRRLGVKAQVRRFDSSSWQHAIDQDQYDMVPVNISNSDAPNASALKNFFGSEAAEDGQKNRNYAKVRSPAVDALIERIDKAATQEEWMAAARALDRVLLGESYFVPLGTNSRDRVAYREPLAHEKDPSPYFGMDPVRTWWSAR